MALVLESNSHGRRSKLSLICLVLGPSSHLEKVKSRDVDTVALFELVLVKMVNIVRRLELLKVWLKKVDWRFVDIKFDDHFMALYLMVVARGFARHHFLTVDRGHEGNVYSAIERAQDLISPLIMHVVQKELAHCKLKRIEFSVFVVKLRINYVFLEGF